MRLFRRESTKKWKKRKKNCKRHFFFRDYIGWCKCCSKGQHVFRFMCNVHSLAFLNSLKNVVHLYALVCFLSFVEKISWKWNVFMGFIHIFFSYCRCTHAKKEVITVVWEHLEEVNWMVHLGINTHKKTHCISRYKRLLPYGIWKNFAMGNLRTLAITFSTKS